MKQVTATGSVVELGVKPEFHGSTPMNRAAFEQMFAARAAERKDAASTAPKITWPQPWPVVLESALLDLRSIAGDEEVPRETKEKVPAVLKMVCWLVSRTKADGDTVDRLIKEIDRVAKASSIDHHEWLVKALCRLHERKAALSGKISLWVGPASFPHVLVLALEQVMYDAEFWSDAAEILFFLLGVIERVEMEKAERTAVILALKSAAVRHEIAETQDEEAAVIASIRSFRHAA